MDLFGDKSIDVEIKYANRSALPEILHINRICSMSWSDREFEKIISKQENNCAIACYAPYRYSMAWSALYEPLATAEAYDALHRHGDTKEFVVGYMIYVMNHGYVKIATMIVHPEMRRRGIGSKFLEYLISKTNPGRRPTIIVPVPDSNLGAHLFLRECGFRAISIEQGEKGGDDTYWFRRSLAAEFVARG